MVRMSFNLSVLEIKLFAGTIRLMKAQQTRFISYGNVSIQHEVVNNPIQIKLIILNFVFKHAFFSLK